MKTPTLDYIYDKYGLEKPTFRSGFSKLFTIFVSHPAIDIDIFKEIYIENDIKQDFKTVGIDISNSIEKIQKEVKEGKEKQLELEF